MTQTTKTVTLDNPIVRGEQTITSIELRKPDSGSLRGVTLTDVLQMDVNALFVVLPRISTPALTKPELLQMDPADLLQLGSEVTVFLLPKSAKVDVSPAA